MTNPITPPPKELVVQWLCEFFECDPPLPVSGSECLLVARAAQYGADQELEACCEWLNRDWHPSHSAMLRAARRPEESSLKSLALRAALIELDPNGKNGSLIIRALEQLDD